MAAAAGKNTDQNTRLLAEILQIHTVVMLGVLLQHFQFHDCAELLVIMFSFGFPCFPFV